MDEKEEKKGLTRRSVIKGAAVGAGAIALTGLGLKEVKAVPPPKKWTGRPMLSSWARLCGPGCCVNRL